MATTTAGAKLTASQRSAQVAIQSAAVAEFLPLWRLLDPRNIDNTQWSWLQLLIELVTRWRARSSASAIDYYKNFRRVETGQLLAPIIRPVGVATQQLTTSLMVTGPIGIKQRLGQGVDPEKAAKLALVETSGAVGRHVLNGGRETLIEAAESDELAVGFARVTSARPCAFCAMLASRGFAYKSRESALLTKSGQKYHDHCACGIEVAFSHDAELPPSTAQWSELWADATEGKSGSDALSAFRDAHAQLLGADAV